MPTYHKGIAFPFQFGSSGGVNTSELTPSDYSRIYQSIYQILFTHKDERVNANGFGSRVKDYLFDSLDDVNTLSNIKFEVEKAIEEQEPRVELIDVNVYADDENEGTLIINIECQILQFSTDISLEYTVNQNEMAEINEDY